ncbi:hypothetical protein GGR95_000597 [Sulfitobacter undariae]|uniref:C-type lysozyme inhibitor domain-containing protein n=1 Tax=Sulfitobacter undariae TaxID=1563671 RepID=A0A7W6E1G4_9RHOB|nr:MliC family protein [Sulfitobacter undariae]MBB3992978.1 hypothetical protein [Sulfitobacter undariae]
MKTSLIPLLAFSLFLAACDEPMISDEIPVSERGNWNNKSSGQLTLTNGSNWNGGGSNWQPNRPNTFGISCPYADPYVVTYVSKNRDAIRTDFGGSRILPRVQAANGEKFSSGEYEIWLNGDQALLTNYLGNTVQCRVTTR